MPRAKKVEVIYADDEVLVVNKPSGISVSKDRTGAPELIDILAEQLGAELPGRLRLVHRLDKDTSGLMIFAKRKKAQRKFSRYFERRLVKKTYLAIVTGPIDSREGTVSAQVARNSRNPVLWCVDEKRGKEAITKWKLLADFGAVALLAVYPLTGRTHQIRVHLPSIGLRLAIDPWYGPNRQLFLSDFKEDYQLGKDQTEKPLIDRLTLHAYQLELADAQPDLPEAFVAGLDKRFAATIKMFTKHNPKGTGAFVDTDDFSRIMNAERLY
jgi:23S rRNA pseudouridine1911/1915/1917 synthase